MINSLLDFEISSKIILGALNNTFKINPLDYCYKALNIKMLPLGTTTPEFIFIKEYISKTKQGDPDNYIKNIYALERKGEAQRISQFNHLKNKMLLWHGSKISNFMGILSQGLRVAPPEAPTTGYRYGKGIYFADMFEKSYNYCYDSDSKTNSRFLLLCEVVLGQ